MAEFNSILQTWTLNLGKCFMTVFMTSKQPTEATNFLLSAKGEKTKGLVHCPGSPRQLLLCAALMCPVTEGPGLAGKRLSVASAHILWTFMVFPRQEDGLAQRTIYGQGCLFQCRIPGQTDSFILEPADIQRGKGIHLRPQTNIPDFSPVQTLLPRGCLRCLGSQFSFREAE